MTEWDRLEWVEHDAAVEPMAWGGTCTVIRVDPALSAAAAEVGTRRVGGWVDEVPVNAGLNRSGVLEDAFLYCGPSLKRRLGVRLGDAVRLRLRPVDPDLVPVPDDVRAVLDERGVLASFKSRRPAERRRLLVPVENAVRPETRQRRIETLARALG